MAGKIPTDGMKSLTNESVEDYAKREMAEVAERERKKKVYWENQKRVAAEFPEHFFELAKQIRAEIDTFNAIVDVGRRVTMHESAGVAAHADPGRAELNVTFGRKGQEAWVGLSELMRLGRGPTAYIIEAMVKLSQARVRVRAEAIPSGESGIRYRVTTDGREAPFSLDQLASKLVLAVVKDDPTQLNVQPGPT